MKSFPYFLSVFLFLLFSSCSTDQINDKNENWAHYLGDQGTNQYSKLDQINKENVKDLKVAWIYDNKEAEENNRSQIQCNPLIIDGVMYGSSARMKFFAINAATGEEIWKFDPFGEGYQQFGMGVNRGLCYWKEGADERIIFTAGSFIYAVNAKTGELIQSFGKNGMVSLHEGLGEAAKEFFVSGNTPGIIYKDLLIQGTRVSESTGAAPGHIRAFNVKTGALEWIFNTIPQPGEFGYETWPEDAYNRIGGANAWAGFSIDEERGIVFVPTGSAAYDFYGGDRHGENLFANCLIALNAATGERIWHFQTVHHDLWDRDLPCPPNLVTVTHNGKKIDAVAQVTKSAYVFLFERETGKPLFPIEEVAVPPSKLEGEEAWPTQPIPTKPAPFSRNRILESDLTQRTKEANDYAKDIYARSVEGAPFIPPTEAGTFVFPGFDGGGEWGGGAFDSESGNLIINASEMAWILRMVPFVKENDGLLATQGKNAFNGVCSSCHGQDLKGASIYPIPSLVNIKERLDADAIKTIIKKGQGQMPAFGFLSDDKVDAITAYLMESEEKAVSKEVEGDAADWPYPYSMTGYIRFKDKDGFPAISPPWGTLNAINLNTGELSWKVVLGDYPGDKGIYESPTGTENYGGPVVTAGGLVFIAATLDEKIRAFDKSNGELLWEADLPAAGYATPATYMVNGKQYIVIAAGGGKCGTKSGDSWVAFSL